VRQAGHAGLAFAVPDIDAERLRLVARGVAMLDTKPWGTCDGIDPEGNVFQLVRK
jgi:predicted enzyme related to lactoylglutathione lyase